MKYEPIPELQGSRALVVDDNADTCMSVSKMLREIGMRPDWTTTGKESIIRAKEAFEQGASFKAYIIDRIMPDMHGIQTVRRIRLLIGARTPTPGAELKLIPHSLSFHTADASVCISKR